MIMLSANPDCYGSRAQASALADYLEALALAGGHLTRAQLVDFIVDNGWHIKSQENFTGIGLGEDGDEPIDAADRILALLNDRVEILGSRYPFTIDAAGRLSAEHIDLGQSYLLLLAITMGHAHKLDIGSPPETLFPSVVAETYKMRGWDAYDFGVHAGDGSSFSDALEMAGKHLKISVDPGATILSKSVKDAGVDCIAHYPWCGARVGRWTTITQVTCAMSNEWTKKLLTDAQPQPWSKLLGELLFPQVVLAVPHHAEPRHRAWLLSQANGSRSLLDRLSLVPYIPSTDSKAKVAIEALISVDVESP